MIESFIMNITSSDRSNKTTVDLTTNTNENIYIEQKDSMTLRCTATGDSIYVSIMKDEKEIKRDFLKDGTRKGNVSVEYRNDNINCQDAGRYKCRFANKHGIQEITQTIIVKCPVQPSRFRSNNVNIMRGGSNFTFICGRHKDVNPAVPYVVSIRSMNGKTLSSTSDKSTTNFTFSYVTCEDMGTYWCETKTQTDSKSSETDLIVHYCPPLLVHTEETVEVDIGNSLYFTVNATMSERMYTVTVIYQTHSQTNNKCGDKLCVDKFTINKWMQQINITIKNITQQDFGNKTVKLCSETDEKNYCSDFYLNIVSTHVCATNVSITDTKSGHLTVNWSFAVSSTSFVIFFANSTGHWMGITPENITLVTPSQYSVTLPYDEKEKAASSDPSPGRLTELSTTFDYNIIYIVVACVFVLASSVLVALLVKRRGKKWLKASLKGRSNSYIQGGAIADSPESNNEFLYQRTSSNTYQPNILDNSMDHTTSRTITVMLRIFLLAFIALLVAGFPSFRNRIPNGNNVPHPCQNGSVWAAVGHYNETSGGQLNRFGVDFETSFWKWDTTLCTLDSDGDGRTNGEELGDPDCKFVAGHNVVLQPATGHPGICEPVDSPVCVNHTNVCNV
ncbi:hypothetical protein Btru_072972 [Bulinus truncatus]|nr:hypothetical protein Btru_072972 [Bulinus truncatus]